MKVKVNLFEKDKALFQKICRSFYEDTNKFGSAVSGYKWFCVTTNFAEACYHGDNLSPFKREHFKLLLKSLGIARPTFQLGNDPTRSEAHVYLTHLRALSILYRKESTEHLDFSNIKEFQDILSMEMTENGYNSNRMFCILMFAINFVFSVNEVAIIKSLLNVLGRPGSTFHFANDVSTSVDTKVLDRNPVLKKLVDNLINTPILVFKDELDVALFIKEFFEDKHFWRQLMKRNSDLKYVFASNAEYITVSNLESNTVYVRSVPFEDFNFIERAFIVT